MRPIPAPRLGDTHGLLRAINQRDRVRLDEFITEFSVEDLFPPGLENALGRTRQFVSFARSAGLLNEDRGVVELTEVGKRYVRSGDADAVFDVSSGQAEWLRRQLFERHMTDSIYHGARDRAVALRLEPAGLPRLPARLRPRARAPRPRGLGQREHAREPGRAVHDLPPRPRAPRRTEPAHRDRDADQVGADAARPHVAARPRGPAQPGRDRGGRGRGRGRVGRPERRARAGARAEPEEPAAVEPEPEARKRTSRSPRPRSTPGSTRTSPARPPRPPPRSPTGRPIPPSDIWETAAPDEVTRAYSAISPEQAAAAAVEGRSPPAEEEESVAPPGMTSATRSREASPPAIPSPSRSRSLSTARASSRPTPRASRRSPPTRPPVRRTPERRTGSADR